MKKVNLLHNPTAGEKDFSKKELSALINEGGFDCSYSSVKEKGWDKFSEETDFLIIAGGDGTVRRTAKALMKRKRLDKQYPLALLPHGTANNIAATLEIDGDVKTIIRSWHDSKLKPFDIGKIYGMGEDLFFLEGFGCGIFPRLIKVMEKVEDDPESTAEDRIKIARTVLYDVVLNYKPQDCKITADGVEYSGKYIMVEVMNTKSIGPNLELAPLADPGDGELDIVLIPESHQKLFENFLISKINGEEADFSFTMIKAKSVSIYWEGKDVHLDDERIKADSPLNVKVDVQPSMLEFLVKA